MQYLSSERLKLVRFNDKYITAKYIDWLNDNRVNRYLNVGRIPESRATVSAPKSDETIMYAIMANFHCISGKDLYQQMESHYIGTASLHHIDWVFRKAELGYMIGEQEYWGKGVATEVISLIADHAFNRLGLNKITAGVVDGNIGSARALEKNGFKQYGISPQDYYLDGRFLDAHLYCKLREYDESKKSSD